MDGPKTALRPQTGLRILKSSKKNFSGKKILEFSDFFFYLFDARMGAHRAALRLSLRSQKRFLEATKF